MPANMITNKRLLGTFVLLLTITFCIGFLVVQAQAGTVFSIESTDPADGQSGVPVSAEVTIEFSDYAKEGSGFGNITFTGGGKDVDFITSGLPGYELVISPQDPLSMSTEYTVTIPKNAVQDDNENPLDKDYTITFFTKGLPDVQTNDATGVTAIAAQLNGQLTNDGGEPCSVKFTYKKTSETTWNEQAVVGTFNTGDSFNAALTGLDSNTEYQFKAVATNSAGTSEGTVKTFTTQKIILAPTVSTNDATGVTAIAAQLNGQLTNDGGEPCSVKFTYKKTSETTWNEQAVVGTFNTGDSFNAALTGLDSNTEYQFKAVATNSAGTSEGTVKTFTTEKLILIPTVSTNDATGVTAIAAQLNGQLTNDGGEPCSVKFTYKKTSETTWNEQAVVGTFNTGDSFNAALTGLDSNTEYQFKAVATNSAGTSEGTVKTFTTEKLILIPTVSTNDATGVTAIAAQLNGQLTNDGGEPCSVKFAYKKTSETTWNEQAVVGTFNTGDSFNAALTGLDSNTEYQFKAVATNSAGTSEGTVKTFTTAEVPGQSAIHVYKGVYGTGSPDGLKPGDTVRIELEVAASNSYDNALIIIRLDDPDGQPCLAAIEGPVPGGATVRFSATFVLPLKTGTYKASAFIWDGWSSMTPIFPPAQPETFNVM